LSRTKLMWLLGVGALALACAVFILWAVPRSSTVRLDGRPVLSGDPHRVAEQGAEAAVLTDCQGTPIGVVTGSALLMRPTEGDPPRFKPVDGTMEGATLRTPRGWFGRSAYEVEDAHGVVSNLEPSRQFISCANMP